MNVRPRRSRVAPTPSLVALSCGLLVCAAMTLWLGPGGTQAAADEERPEVWLDLADDGRLSRSGKDVAPDDLPRSSAEGPRVVVRVAPRCSGELLRRALGRLRDQGVEKVALVETPP